MSFHLRVVENTSKRICLRIDVMAVCLSDFRFCANSDGHYFISIIIII